MTPRTEAAPRPLVPMPSTDHDSTDLGSWGDEFWGPRDPAIIDLRPEIGPARRPPKEEPVQTVDGDLPAFAHGDEAALDGIRVELASHVTQVSAVLDELRTQVATIASGDGLRFLVRTAVAETVEAVFTRLHGEHLAQEGEAHQEQLGQPDTVVPRIAGSLGEELESLRSGGQRQIAEATAVFEQALGALSRAVANERHSSAALVRGSLANTDQAIRDAYSWLQQYLDSVLHVAREAAATASAAAEETRSLRRDLRHVLGRVPPAQGGE